MRLAQSSRLQPMIVTLSFRPGRRDERPHGRAYMAGDAGDVDNDVQSVASADSYSYSDDDSDAGRAFIVLNRHLTCYKCHADFPTHNANHIRNCTPFNAVQAESVRSKSPADPSLRTCGYCNTCFDSRNKLFRHLKSCEDAKKGLFRAPSETADSDSDSESDSESTETEQDNAFNAAPVVEGEDFELQIAPTAILDKANDSPMPGYPGKLPAPEEADSLR
ncbi:hypothetical protein B0T19DRAFT_386952 [Cercophora scortea]|uniref:Uncharacterized protein n=1 Tax=Cercophora scortea TaxID=314031 RepID=A0AAE0IH50_9PEZI|nr:hypothetical protein B0T19DRAFT_386952 [Cercophora scortea]